jgi:uncharacterized protein involved in exopolysaccharide biosynthesis
LNTLHEPFETHSFTWSELQYLFRKYRLLVLVVFLTGVAGAWLSLQVFFTEGYESTTTLLVKLGRENAETPETVQNGQMLIQGVRLADINSEVQMLSSRALAEAVVDQLGPDTFKPVLPPPKSVWGYPKYYVKRTARWAKSQWKEFLILANLKKRLALREEAILAVGKGIKVEPVKDSDVLTLKVRMPGSRLSVDVAQALLQHYMDRRAVVRRAAAGQAFFDAQVEAAHLRVEQLRRKRAGLRSGWNLVSPTEERSLLLRQLADLESESVRNRNDIATLRSQLAAMESSLQHVPDTIQKEQVNTQNPSIQSIKERLTNLQLERSKLTSRYQPDSDLVQKVDSEIKDLEGLLSKENPTIVAAVTNETHPVTREFTKDIQHHRVRIQGLLQREEELKTPAAEIKARLERLNRGNDSLEDVEREFRMAEAHYLGYMKRREDARVAQELDERRIQNVAIMAGPDIPIEPVYPRSLFIMGIALPVSLILGVALAALLESLDDRIVSERDLLLAGAPVRYLGELRYEPEMALNGAAKFFLPEGGAHGGKSLPAPSEKRPQLTSG